MARAAKQSPWKPARAPPNNRVHRELSLPPFGGRGRRHRGVAVGSGGDGADEGGPCGGALGFPPSRSPGATRGSRGSDVCRVK